MIRVGILGSGFIADSYADSLRDVRDGVLAANFSRNPERAADFAARWNSPHTYTDIAALCADPDIDVVVVALPNEAHVEAVRIAAAAGKGIICTKPLARTGAEAAEILRIVEEAGVWHGYAESSVFSPNVAKAH